MLQSAIGKILLAPFSLLYGASISIRNALYNAELVRSSKFSLPIIAVGNLSVGGAGKTPHIEYLIKLLSPYINVATLSRGYKRQTKGFRFVRKNESVLENGDEPLMYARKYDDIVVAVAESRSIAIPQMVGRYPRIQTILLDDAFQHRSISPSLNILLTTYDEPFTRDYILPSGRLREWRSSYKRADIIIVTKCPSDLSIVDKYKFEEEINPYPHQKVFFSYYSYDYPYNFYNPKQRIYLDEKLDVVLISAIANTNYLLSYLNEKVESIHHMDYEDHHLFTETDVDYIIKVFQNRDTVRKVILTTEKDAMRLDLHRAKLAKAGIPIFILPAKVAFHFDGRKLFDEEIKNHLLNFKS